VYHKANQKHIANGGGLYIVEFEPGPVEKLIFGDKGKIVAVHARSEKEAKRKALKMAK